jgi:hypothetical protein
MQQGWGQLAFGVCDFRFLVNQAQTRQKTAAASRG